MNWSAALQARSVQSTDISFDMALDLLTAQALLASAGLSEHEDALAGLLVQSAQQLAPLAAACHPEQRQTWAQTARVAAVVGMEAQALQLEAAVARVAVEWAAVSAYASDVLFDPALCGDVDLVIFIQGLSPDPLVAGLKAAWGKRLQQLNLVPDALDGGEDVQQAPQPVWLLHPCLDGEDEAQRTAACALQHIAQGEFPLALVSSDRALTRRVRSMLEAQGVRMRDETGWKLSTSAAAAQVMALLKAGAWNASTDSVLAWLKQVPERDDICRCAGSRTAATCRARLACGRWCGGHSGEASVAAPVPGSRRLDRHLQGPQAFGGLDRHFADRLAKLGLLGAAAGRWSRCQGSRRVAAGACQCCRLE